jgi:Transcriptional antiterminator
MTLNALSLRVLNYVQNRKTFSLQKSEQRFGKSSSTIKRTIAQINEFLPEGKRLIIKNDTVKSTLSYDDKIAIIQRITFAEYHVNRQERIMLLIFASFFEGVVNMTKIYQKMELSETTKKQDRKKIASFLENQKLFVKTFPGMGIEITGAEAASRMFISSTIAVLLECDSENDFFQREANNPVEREMCNIFLRNAQAVLEESKQRILAFLNQQHFRLDYASKKLLLIYFSLSILRQQREKIITEVELLSEIQLPKLRKFFTEPSENHYINLLIASLNYNVSWHFPHDKKIFDFTKALVHYVQRQIRTTIICNKQLIEACYSYIYKCTIKNALGYQFYDDKLDEVHIEYPHLIKTINIFMEQQEENIEITLKNSQIGTLSLIFSSSILRNKVYKKTKKCIVIITNSSSEKIEFFTEQLKKYVDFELVEYLTINELFHLSELTYDAVITFSSRITNMVKKQGIEAVQMPFYLEEIHAKVLIERGFSTNYRRKITKEEMMQKLVNKSAKEIEQILAEYPDHFI